MSDDPRRDLITRHVERQMGGRVASITQQPRWRPTWFLDLERDGELLPLCVRGERSDTVLTFPLEHEMRFQRVLQDRGIPVPGYHMWIDELPAIVMDRVSGRPDFAGVDAADRERIVEEYFDTLARMHTLPLDAFDAAGIARAPTPEQSGSFGIVTMFDHLFHAQKAGPDPFCEWAVGWIARHLPQSHGREAPVVWDSGQLHHDDHHFISLIDLELGHVGDPMMDLAALRMRDSIIPFGNFDEVYAKYEIESRSLGGPPLDMEAIELHHIAFTITNELSFGHTLRSVVPASDFGTNLQWCNETNIYVTEAIADYLGVELPEVDVPQEADVPARTSVASAYLAQLLRSAHIEDPMERYRLRGAFRVAQHVARCDEIGDAITRADLDDAHQVLGHRPASWFDGEVELEQFVLADAAVGRHDEALLPLFHRRNLRAQMLNGPAGSAMARHNPIQRFPLGPRVAGAVA